MISALDLEMTAFDTNVGNVSSLQKVPVGRTNLLQSCLWNDLVEAEAATNFIINIEKIGADWLVHAQQALSAKMKHCQHKYQMPSFPDLEHLSATFPIKNMLSILVWDCNRLH